MKLLQTPVSRLPDSATLTMLVAPEPPTLVALTNAGDPTMLVSAKVTEGLLAYDFDLTPRAQLAVAWAVNPHCTEFSFKLRQGVRWHDGTPFTSHDVASSIALLRELHARGRATFANLTEVRTPDPHTAIVVLSKPSPYLLYALAASESPITPAHIYAGDNTQTNPNGVAPIGTGPFIFREWVRASHIVFERNPDYWDKPKPWVDRLVIRFIEDEQAQLAAIESHAIDLAPAISTSLKGLRRLQSNPDLDCVADGYQYTNQVVRLEFNLEHPILGSLGVRQAIAHTLNRQDIIDQAWLGYADPAYGPISPHLKRFFSPNLPTYTFDLHEAERLLDEAGYPRGADKVRFRLPLDYIPAAEGYKNTAYCVAQMLARVGIAAELRTQDFFDYIQRIYTDRNFAFSVNRMNNMFDPSVGVQRLYWSKSIRKGVPFSNASHYINKEVDALLEQAAVEPDLATRIKLFKLFQEKIIHDLPDLTLLAPKLLTIANQHVVDHTVTADGIAGNLANARIKL